MKQLAWMLAFLIVLGVVLTAPVIAWRAHPGRDCANEVRVVKGPHGQEVECVCLGGTLATCFFPGP